MKVKALIILVICILFISSCSSLNGVDKTESTSSPQISPTATPDYTEARANAKKLVWIIDVRNTYNVDPQIFIDFNNLLLEKGAGFIVDFVGIDSTDVIQYSEQIRIMKSNGSKVDILETGYGLEGLDYQTFPEAVKDGLLEPLDEFLETTDGQKLYNTIDKNAWESVKIGNKIYGINNKANLAYPLYLHINKEIKNEYMIQLPEKIDNLSKLESAYKQISESQKTVDKDKAIVALDNFLPSVKRLINCVYMDNAIAVKYDDNGYPLAFNVFEDPEFTYLVGLAYDYINNGYIRADQDAYENISNGLFFATIGLGHNEYCFDGKLALNKTVAVDTFMLTDGYVMSQMNAVNGIASWSQNKEEAFKLLSMINTDSDLSNLLRYGILGKHYELDDGRVVKLDTKYRAPGYFSPANQVITHPIGLEPLNKTEAYKELHSNLKMSPTAGFILDKSNISDDLLTIRGIYEKYETIYTGKVNNFREELDKANKELKEANLDMILDEINSQLTSWWTEKESEGQSIEKNQ